LTAYLDTSVLVSLFTFETHSESARSLVTASTGWTTSDWALAEFSAAIRTKARRGELQADHPSRLDGGLDAFIEQAGSAVPVIDEDHWQARFLIVADGRLRAPDALHIAVAQRIDATLATFDANLARAAREAGVMVIDA
jgi:hypothetical protein